MVKQKWPSCATCKHSRGLGSVVYCALEECTMSQKAARGCERWEERD